MESDSVAYILGEDGPFSKRVDNYTTRAAQVEMAAAIEETIAQKQTLLAESGTGTGKTFAYLVPALLSGKKTLVSTGTKHLQEQLYHRDIPKVLETLGLNAKVSLLKGRSNYLCLHRMSLARGSSRRLDSVQLAELEAVNNWAPKSSRGDIGDLTEVPEDSRIWPQVTSTIDNCIGQDCSFFEDCFVNKARKAAMASDVVVVNHHLFFADKALKNDGFGALLPDVDTVIFDEAHQIPDIASNFLGTSFSSWQVMELCNDTRAAELKEKSLISKLVLTADELDKVTADYRLSLGLNERRVSWVDLLDEIPNLPKKLTMLANKLTEFSDVLEQASVAGEGLTRCYERALELSQACQRLADETDDGDVVRWVEVARRTFRVHETPLNIGGELSHYFGNKLQARIFTSATLSIDGDFSHFQQLIGLQDDAVQRTWESPFDYFNQAVLYVPEGMPQPKEDSFTDALFEEVLPILQASNGGVFVLFTSFRILQGFAEKLAEFDFNVLTQGDTSKRELLADFVAKPRSVLLGTMSFWEGVDVPGDALRCVIIDKLPFESPFDPVIKARLNAMQAEGNNPFMNYQVPRAVITLRQGAGRLIRSVTDKGVLMICDPRLRTTRYGRTFLNSLPRMRRTHDRTKVTQFLARLAQGESPQ
ncbi:ATP-dependent DNA helicase [Arenicella xantha]|uniref:DNA 5'-3' helicase n=1 Tax=Arenicella xantha TaxID=644221 RepID=A0A395JP98_9GAMM|nr:ATP-dependent DNA helicase [Arenicella xantha]RBP51617.1 ATP-dependent DNA helicase DinG [Arenicella xantha]